MTCIGSSTKAQHWAVKVIFFHKHRQLAAFLLKKAHMILSMTFAIGFPGKSLYMNSLIET